MQSCSLFWFFSIRNEYKLLTKILCTSNILHLNIYFAQLVLEELAAGRHHHFVHIDVVVLGAGKIMMKIISSVLKKKLFFFNCCLLLPELSLCLVTNMPNKSKAKTKFMNDNCQFFTSQTMSRSTRPDWRRSCWSCSQSTRLWSWQNKIVRCVTIIWDLSSNDPQTCW